MKSYKLVVGGVICIAVEAIAIRLWVYGAEPDPSVSIGIVIIAPFLFGVNVLVATVLYFRKAGIVFRFFLINAFVAPMIFYWAWNSWYSGRTETNYTVYSFTVRQQNFELTLSRTSDDF